MKTFIAVIMMLFGALTVIRAQNKIDEIVEKFSTVGFATFTSVVERDPETRKVQKVVKVLKFDSMHLHPEVERVFKQEMDSGDVMTSAERGTTAYVLTRKNKNDTRIYSLTYNTMNKNSVVVTIIIKYRKTDK